MSAESGISTFRDTGGLWEKYSIEEVATPEAFQANPELVLEFYNHRRKQLDDVQPNEGHIALARLQEKYDVQITEPERNGFHVGKSKNIKGTAKILEDEFLWVLIHRTKGFKYVWYPQGEGEIDPETKMWELTATFGENQDIGYDFEIAVIIVNDKEHRILVKYIEDAMISGDWRPIKMPPTQTVPVYRKVKKVSH